ncbi:MAG TPA: FG-GAP repeat protein [Streptosporangiaceae bacterium]|jgi:hypothetical protein|nr:FG-GAP repeat protein [Streptosporangiaceae bacterium]
MRKLYAAAGAAALLALAAMAVPAVALARTACLAGHLRTDGRLVGEDLYPVLKCCAPEISGLAVGDLNGDGRPDIAVAASADVAVLYQK